MEQQIQEGLSSMLCGVSWMADIRLCAMQVIDECTPDGHISPATCIYMNDWLDF